MSQNLKSLAARGVDALCHSSVQPWSAGPLFPAEITVDNDDEGRPFVVAEPPDADEGAGGVTIADLRVSLAHTEWAAAAVVAGPDDAGDPPILARQLAVLDDFDTTTDGLCERRQIADDGLELEHGNNLRNHYLTKSATVKNLHKSRISGTIMHYVEDSTTAHR